MNIIGQVARMNIVERDVYLVTDAMNSDTSRTVCAVSNRVRTLLETESTNMATELLFEAISS